jgi:hypothetical protein
MKKIFLSAVLVTSSWVLFAQDTTINRTNDTTNTNNNTTTNQQMNANQNMNTTTNQNPTPNQTYNATTTSTYSAYGIPDYVQMNFQTQHPGASNLVWDKPTADWYHGYYSNSGRYTHVYYSTDPYYNVKYYPERITGYTVSLPVLQTYVPDDVISRAGDMYKQNLYDITALRTKDSQTVYQVRVQDNGELKSMWMDSTGGAVTEYWRTNEQVSMPAATDVNSATSTETNAAMNDNSMNNMNNNAAKTKVKTKASDGTINKTKTKNGQSKTKKSTSNTNDQY